MPKKALEAAAPPIETPAEPQPPEEEAAVFVEPAPVSNPDYRTNTWAGLPHFECLRCPFDSLDEESMWWHIHDSHSQEV